MCTHFDDCRTVEQHLKDQMPKLTHLNPTAH